jgi:Kef-type K+ transport system membrane component KefB
MPSAPVDLLSTIGICIAAAALLALLGWRLRQPLILAYLLTGVIIGPIGLRWVGNPASISTVAEIGLILLLFIIGLEIDLKKLASAGAPVLLTGALQVPICVALGLGFFYALGYRSHPGNYALLYLAATMSLSSTLVVVKLLYDKFELDTLPGRITLGVLVIQDLWAVAMLAVQPNLENPNLLPLALSLLKGAALVLLGLVISKNVLPHLFRAVAKAPELVLVSALAWCFFLAAVASTIGLSREMGALIAGVSLSTFPYSLDVIAKATSIRDFFVTLFFVALGMEIPVPSLGVVGLALIASGFLIVSRLVVVPMLYWLRLGHRTSLIPAVNLANISEFSIVIASLGLVAHPGHPAQIGPDILTVVILTFAITSVVSTYMINANHSVQKVLAWALVRAGIRDLKETVEKPEGEAEKVHSVIFLGFFRDASSILYELEVADGRDRARHRRKEGGFLSELLVIDFNPRVIQELRRRGIACTYGDIAHIDTLHHVGIEAARLVVSSITDDILRGTTNLRLMRNTRALCPEAKVVVTSEHIRQATELYEAGADFVYVPRLHSAAEIARILREGLRGDFPTTPTEAMHELRERHEVLD